MASDDGVALTDKLGEDVTETSNASWVPGEGTLKCCVSGRSWTVTASYQAVYTM